MKKSYLKVIFFVAISVILVGCAGKKPLTKEVLRSPQAALLDAEIQAGEYEQNVDTFMIILDKSGSMGELYKGKTKLSIARDIVSRMNQTIPDIKLNGGLRIFGRMGTFSTRVTENLYGPAPYTREGLENGLNKLDWARGISPLEVAINASDEGFNRGQEQKALIIISDGKELKNKLVVKAAQDLKNRYGSCFCIYPVLVGKDPEGMKVMKQLAQVSQCGFFESASQIQSQGFMTNYVRKVFLKKVEKVEVVVVEETVVVIEKPAPMDSDGDGVYDNVDQCPNTPMGARVNERGCWVIEAAFFDFDKRNIKPQYFSRLDDVVAVLKANPSLTIEIEGNTDSIGTPEYNMSLSEKRANSIKGYLVKMGIAENRLLTVGYGFTRPIANNATTEGRAMNRRAELTPVQ